MENVEGRKGPKGRGLGYILRAAMKGGLGTLHSISAPSARQLLQVQTLIETAALKIHPDTSPFYLRMNHAIELMHNTSDITIRSFRAHGSKKKMKIEDPRTINTSTNETRGTLGGFASDCTVGSQVITIMPKHIKTPIHRHILNMRLGACLGALLYSS
jgi:hypothetical protein